VTRSNPILTLCALMCFIGCLMWAFPAYAQPQQMGPLVVSLNGGFAAQTESDLKDTEGAFSVNRWFLAAGVDYVWDRRTSLGISFGAGESTYDFTGLTANGGEAPWGTAEDQRLSLIGRFGFGETGSVIIIPSYRYNGEKDSDSGEARTWGLLAGAAWRISEDLTIGPGIGVFSQLEDSSRVFPILVIDWNITERWSLSTGRGLAASQGPGLTLSYQFRPTWSFGLAGRYEDVRFRLDETGPVPNGVGRDKSFPMVLSAAWDPTPKVGLSLFAGAEIAGELELQDPDGVTVESSDYDAAPLLGFSFNVKF
jgi:hypothetical protein